MSHHLAEPWPRAGTHGGETYMHLEDENDSAIGSDTFVSLGMQVLE
jgi:hypothetical protein